MKSKFFPRRLKGRISSKQLLALLLSLACVATCTVGAIIGFTFASDDGKLQIASPGAAGVNFGGGELRAYLAENPVSAAIPVDSDTLHLVLEIAGPTAPGGGGMEPGECGCAEAILCGGDACLGCPDCQDAYLCGGDACLGCPDCQDAYFCGGDACLGCPDCQDAYFCGGDACLGCPDCTGDDLCGGDKCDFVCEDCTPAILCGGDKCDFVCEDCTPAILCGGDKCDFVCEDCTPASLCGGDKCDFVCEDCIPAVPCECDDCECTGCVCCGEGGEEGEAAVLDGVTLYAELPEHIRDYFTLDGIVLSPDPGVTEVTRDDALGIYEYSLDDPLEEGMVFRVTFVLTFDRDAFNETPPSTGELPMLENIQASYTGLGEPASIAPPTVEYPEIDTDPGTDPGTETGEGLHAVINTLKSKFDIGFFNPVADGDYVVEGDILYYEIVITNDSGEDAELLQVEAPVPTGTVFQMCYDGAGLLISEPSESPLLWEIPLLAAGESITLSFAVKVEALPEDQTSRFIQGTAIVAGDLVEGVILEQYADYQYIGDLFATLSALPDGGAVSAGNPIEYTIKVTNFGGAALTDIPVRCTIPDGTTLFTVDPAPEDESEDELSWLIDLAPGGTVTLTFTVVVQELPAGSTGRDIKADAFLTPDLGEDEEKIGSVTHTQSPAQLTIAKRGEIGGADVDDANVWQGDIITYTVSVTNVGGNPAYGVEITDALPDNLDYVAGTATGEGTPVDLTPDTTVACDVDDNGVTDEGVNKYNFRWTINQLPPGDTAEVSFQARVTALPETLSGRPFDNIASVNGEETNPVSCWQPDGSLSAEKYAVPPEGAYVRTDDTILYTIRMENVSARPKYDVLIQDNVPEGTEFDDTFEPSATVDGIDLVYESPLPADETDKPGLYSWSEEDGTVQFIVGEIPAGSVAEATFRVKVLAPEEESPQSTRDIENTAKVEGKDTNTVKHIQALHDIAAVKTADPADGATVYARKADGSGTRITYSIKVTNTTGLAKTDVEIEDTLPEGLVYVPGSMTDEDGVQGEIDESGKELRWLVESLAPGDSATVQFKADVSQLTGSAGRSFVNSALADGYATNDVTHYQYPTSLRAEKSAVPAPGPVEEDDIITYSIEVENTGDADEFSLPVFDSIPDGTEYVDGSALLTIGSWSTDDVVYDEDDDSLAWIIPQLEAGKKAIITFQVKVLPLDEGTGMRTISNTAQAGEGGLARMTNTVTHQQGAFDLAIEKSADRTRVAQGGTVTYTIAVTNNGGAAAALPVSDSIPDGMTYVPDSATQNGNIALQETTQGGAVTKLDWVIASLAPEATAVITFQVKADALTGGTQSRFVENIAEVCGLDTNGVSVEVYSHLLSAVPPSGSTVQVGGTITYKISLYNAHEDDLPALNVVNKLPAGTALVVGSITGIGNGGYVFTSDSVVWNIEALPFGLTELTFQVIILHETGGGEIRNKALIYGYGGSVEETNEVLHNVTLPDLFAVKSADRPGTDVLRPGDTLTYTITVSNNADEAMEAIPVLDVIPANTTYVAGSADNGGVYDADAKSVKWSVDIAAQDNVKLSFKVTVDDIESGCQVSINNRAFYGPENAAIPDIYTNQVTYLAGAADVVPTPGLEASLSAVPGISHIFRPGETITYTITVTNTGGTLLGNLLITCPVPGGTTFAGTGTPSWVLESLAPGGTVAFTFDVTVDALPRDKDSAVIACRATVVCGDLAVQTQEVLRYVGRAPDVAAADVTVTKGADVPEGQVKAGQRIVYALCVENRGDAEAKGIAVRDILPAGVLFLGSPEGRYDAIKREISWAIPSLEAGKSKTLTFTVAVNINLSAAPLSVKNKAYYIPGAGLAEVETNEITHVVPGILLTPGNIGTINIGNGGINIGNGIVGSGNIGSGNIGSGNINSGNVNSGNASSGNASNGSSGGNGSNGSNGYGNIGGKDIPKTSEASALWAVILTLGSGTVATAAATILIRKKKALARKH